MSKYDELNRDLAKQCKQAPSNLFNQHKYLSFEDKLMLVNIVGFATLIVLTLVKK